MAAEGPVYIISLKDYYKFLLLCPSFTVFDKWTKNPEVKYVPCLLLLASLKSNSFFFSHKNYSCYHMISLYRVKYKKTQSLNCLVTYTFSSGVFLLHLLVLGKTFFFSLPYLHFCKNSPAPPLLPTSLRHDLLHRFYSSSACSPVPSKHLAHCRCPHWT